jgi:hypothetical protein
VALAAVRMCGWSTRPLLVSSPSSYKLRFNFFDPDAFFVVCSMVYSGEPALFQRAKHILQLTAKYIPKEHVVPHHLIFGRGIVFPAWNALSTASQPGPNIFWTLSCLRYAGASGDLEFLVEIWPTIGLLGSESRGCGHMFLFAVLYLSNSRTLELSLFLSLSFSSL